MSHWLLYVRKKATSQTSAIIATELEIGKTYVFSDYFYFKLTDNNSFVYLIDEARFETEEDLEEYRRDQEYWGLYPQFRFLEGIYDKSEKGYVLTFSRELIVEFKNVSKFKNNIIAYKKLENELDPTVESTTLNIHKKSNKFVATVNEDYVYESDRELPNSVEEFLEQYEYEPEELE